MNLTSRQQWRKSKFNLCLKSEKETRRLKGVDVDFHRKGISATMPLAKPIGKSSISYGGEGSLAPAITRRKDAKKYVM